MRMIFLFTALMSVLGTTAQGSLELNVVDIPKSKGIILVNLFNQETGYPSEFEKAFRNREMLADDKGVSIRFDDLPPGKYVVSIFHDENENRKMDSGLFGIPKEGYAFSNNAKAPFGPPRYDKAEIEIAEGQKVTQLIRLIHW